MTAAITARAGEASIVVEPELGGRITSLRLGGREWLQQPVVAPVAANTFDDFVRPGMGGWDEMVPTCTTIVDDGVALPDHGEVWTRVWDVVAADNEAITLAVDCQIVPLRVERTARLAPDRLTLDYNLVNRADMTTPAFWMAHPLFDATDLTDVTFTPDVEMVQTASESAEPDRRRHLRPSTLPPGGYRKHRCTGPVESVTLHAGDGTALTMTWTAPVPVHVQLWVDNAGIGPVPVVAPEPAIAAGDDPVFARSAGALPLIDPGASLAFSVTCSIVR